MSWRTCRIIPAVWLVLATSGLAHDDHDHPPRRVADVDAHRPTPLPDRIILTWSGDPTTTQAVTWRTDTTVGQGRAELALATDNAEFAKQAQPFVARREVYETDLGKAHYHSIEFTDLVPDTKYAYRVGDGANWSEWFQFTTAAPEPRPFSFVYFGDAQNDVKSHWSRVVREALRDTPQVRFMLHAGDLINHANSDAEWGEWFQAGGWANGMIPSVPVTGNHEYFGGGLLRTAELSKHWRPQFTLPTNGPESLPETAYWFDFQGVRVIALNSNVPPDTQTAWLDKLLTENPHPWTVVSFHHPIFSAARLRDNPVLRDEWQPIFDKHGVDLVLQGHDHTYARSRLVGTANTATGLSGQAKSGTVYVVSVSGPKMYPLGSPIREEFRRVAEDTQLFQIITIDGDELRYRAKTPTGKTYDGFTLRRVDGAPNVLIDEVPDTPDRRR